MRTWVVTLATGVVGAAIGAGAVHLRSDAFLYGGREHIDLDRWARAEDAWAQMRMTASRASALIVEALRS